MADITQRVVWTACPAGQSADGKFLHINLHVSPRLDLAAGTQPADLSHFPAWHDWPATLASARFAIHGLGAGPLKAEVIPADDNAWPPRDADGDFVPDGKVWQALFPTDTPVIPHAFDDLRSHDVLTYPLAALADAIETAYVDLALDPSPGLPRTRELINRHPLFASSKSDKPTPTLPQLLDLLRSSDSIQALSHPDTMIALLEAYHRPLAKQVMRQTAKRLLPDGTPDFSDPHEAAQYRTVERVPLTDPDQFREIIDFHRIAASVGQHPALMRLAGLVVPLRVPADGIAPGTKAVRVEVQWKPGDVDTLKDGFCTTTANVGPKRFFATPKTAQLFEGWLRAGTADYSLVQMDVDGAGLSIKNFATQLPRIREERYDDEGGHDTIDTTGTPRLRTAGIQFAQVRRDRAIRGLFASAGGHDDKLNGGGAVVLHAEDLIKGWRVDVLDEQRGKWQSLMRFDGEYGLRNSGDTVATRDEEGIARLSATATADDSAPADLQKILKASEALFGWTGWSLAAPLPGKAIMPDDVTHEAGPNTAPPGLPLDAAFVAHKGSLPALRFGHRYRVRLRSADLAGWGPRFTLDGAPAPGIETAKLFYGRYEPVETPVLTVPDDDPAPADGESMPRAALRAMDDAARDTTMVRRNVHPARVAARFAETHGVVDDGGGRPRGEMWDVLATRDSDFKADLVTTEPWVPEGAPPSHTKVETHFTRSSQQQPTPYLADPLTGGVAIRVTGVPAIDPHKLHFVPFYADEWKPEDPLTWLKDRSFEIVAIDDGGSVGWDPGRRIFRVPLPKAERARLHISAVVPDGGIELFKLREQIIVRDGEQAWRKIEPRVRAGQHWMFTPSRMVELVHATQRPLIVPRFIKPHVERVAGALKSRLIFRTPLHAKSTARLDVDGDWIEIDDTAPGHPRVRRVSAHAFDYQLARLETPNDSLEIRGDHVFGDTRARFVTYRAVATTRFREFMPPDIRSDPANVIVASEPSGIWVPSATRPPAPAVRYVIPTFGWTRTEQGDVGRRSWRRGGGLRVYLDRPWFTSGSNEMLGVCLPRDSIPDPADSLARNHVTQWGADPAWVSDRVETIAPAAVHFPLRVRSGNDLRYDLPPEDHPDAADASADGKVLPGFAAGPYIPHGSPVAVDVVPHAVGYDDTRNLWYADIVVNPGETYFPFIRLALARFQPASVSGLHLSAAVLADFAQLTPDRLAITTRGERGDMRIVEVYGHTPVPRGSAQAGDVRVELQRLPEGADVDLGWVPADQAPPPPPPGGQGTPGSIGGRLRDRVAIPQGGVVVPRVLETRMLDRATRIARLDAPSRARLIEAERLLDLGEFQTVLIDPGMLEIIRPPLIHREVVHLPQRDAGDRLRLLITEHESYETGPEPDGRAGRRQERIIYAEAMEV